MVNYTTGADRKGGRKKEFDAQVALSLSAIMLAQIDGARQPGEARLDLIRTAIERELKRRAKAKA